MQSSTTRSDNGIAKMDTPTVTNTAIKSARGLGKRMLGGHGAMILVCMGLVGGAYLLPLFGISLGPAGNVVFLVAFVAVHLLMMRRMHSHLGESRQDAVGKEQRGEHGKLY